MKMSKQQVITALNLCGVGLEGYEIELDSGPFLCYDKDTTPSGHTTDNVTQWQEVCPKGSIVEGFINRHGLITHAGRVTQLEGKFPSTQQKVIEFGRFLLDNPSKPEPHPLEVAYSNDRFSFLNGIG